VKTIDINVDCGESFGNWRMGADEEVMPYVSSANVACGFHASDPVTMDRSVSLAKEHGVAVGAHPGLPDLVGFGRRVMAISPEDTYAYVLYQVGALQAFLTAQDMPLHHVKPHGAFYTLMRDKQDLADAFMRAVSDLCPDVVVYFPAPIAPAAIGIAGERYGIPVIGEIYPDLEYDDEGALVLQRSKEHTPIERAVDRVRCLLEHGAIETLSGKRLPIDAASMCIHGDGPDAAAVASAVRQAVADSGVEVSAPASRSAA
jgi:UPF0271 protein